MFKALNWSFDCFLYADIALHSTKILQNSKQDCSNCQNLQLELEELHVNSETLRSELNSLKESISPKNDKIPHQLWDIFPPNGNYIWKILMHCGYETYDSVVNLKQDGEIENAFSFVKDNIAIFDNKE